MRGREVKANEKGAERFGALRLIFRFVRREDRVRSSVGLRRLGLLGQLRGGGEDQLRALVRAVAALDLLHQAGLRVLAGQRGEGLGEDRRRVVRAVVGADRAGQLLGLERAERGRGVLAGGAGGLADLGLGEGRGALGGAAIAAGLGQRRPFLRAFLRAGRGAFLPGGEDVALRGRRAFLGRGGGGLGDLQRGEDRLG